MQVIHVTLKLKENLLALLQRAPAMLVRGELHLDIDARDSVWGPSAGDYTDLINWRTKVCRAELVRSEISVSTKDQFETMHRLSALLAPFNWRIQVTNQVEDVRSLAEAQR